VFTHTEFCLENQAEASWKLLLSEEDELIFVSEARIILETKHIRLPNLRVVSTDNEQAEYRAFAIEKQICLLISSLAKVVALRMSAQLYTAPV